MSQEEDQLRLKKAKEFLDWCKEAEDQARKTLADYAERTKFARNKYNTLFAECEARAVARAKEQNS